MRPPPSSQRCFTLIEMLVAVSVMSLMLFMMAVITGTVEQAWRMEQNRIDNFSKARSMVDMVTDDLQRAVIRGDLPVFGAGAPTNSPTATSSGLYYFTGTTFTNAFYTRMPGIPSVATSQVRDLSLVSYALNTTNSSDKIVLQRSDLAVPWTSAQNVAFQGDMSTLLANATPREVAPGVVGFRLAFRRADGTMIDESQYTGFNSTNPVVAVDVGLAVIGSRSLAQLNATQIQTIKTAFANATISNGVKASWDQNVLTPSFYTAYPKDFGTGIKTFERWVNCPQF
jgi:prepilin-type N-terminal cleavage/methylation domain-containing protein